MINKFSRTFLKKSLESSDKARACVEGDEGLQDFSPSGLFVDHDQYIGMVLHHWFMSMEDAQDKIDRWRIEDNTFRPHSSLDDMTPEQFEETYEKEARNSTLELILKLGDLNLTTITILKRSYSREAYGN